METSHYNEENRLQELGGSDYEIADHQPNIKGWTVKNAQGQTIGEVDELIFDVQTRKVRYMVVDLEDNILDLESRDVLVPIGLAELRENEDDVLLPSVTAEQLRALPTYEKGRLDRHTETSIRSIFGTLGAGAAAAGAAYGASSSTENDFYSHEHFNDQNYSRNQAVTDTSSLQGETMIPIIEETVEVAKQEVETGGAHISSRVVERQVEEHIRLREEHVHVERVPVNRPATAADLNAFQEGEIQLTEHAEVPVVNKEARVVEEITLEKEVEERDEVIRDTARSTEVDIERRDATPTPSDSFIDPSRPRTDGDLL